MRWRGTGRRHSRRKIGTQKNLSGLDYFGGAEGFLAYTQVGSTAFVLSNPLAPIGGCEDLMRSFVSERSDVCFWQASRPVARILEKIGFCVNEMGTETRIELGGYDFDGPRKRNFRRALNRAACCSYTIAGTFRAQRRTSGSQALDVKWKGRDSTPRPRHYELTNRLEIGCQFNGLPSGVRCNWHHRAQLSTTDSRKTPSGLSRYSGARLWCIMCIAIHIIIHSNENDPNDHRRTSPEGRRQDNPSAKDHPIGVHSRCARGGDPPTTNSRGRGSTR